MPKLNVYLPDDLADAVKDTGLPVSTICQRALEQSVKRVSAIRATVVGDLNEEDPTAELTQFTQRAKDVVTLAITHARERGAAEIGTRDLLAGMLGEGTNLGFQVLRSVDVEPATVLRELARVESRENGGPARRMSRTAATALELTVTEAISLGHNYVGCEHLLLGLLAEPDGAGGAVLRGLGVEPRGVRQAVSAALTVLVAQQQMPGSNSDALTRLVTETVGTALQPLVRRLERLEERVSG